jgi:glycosyltransferase involved in cell wall biosynthesis
VSDTIAVIIPAFRVEDLILEAVRSVRAQTHADWQIWVIADDAVDYEHLLGRHGLVDPRFRFLSTGAIGAGASIARNLALDAIDTRYLAILDADDRMKPDKLAAAISALADQPIVSSALDVMATGYRRLRLVGAGADRVLSPADYKFTSISMDSMIVWDRSRCDARYDTTLTNMTDLELLMQLWRTATTVHHLGRPLHDYLKRDSSMSNGAGVTERMVRAKTTLLERLLAGHYNFADPAATEGLAAFLRISLAAEAAYPAAIADRPGLLFEDHLEPMLRTDPRAR